MSKSVRTFAFNFWEMIAFLASSAAFLYLGISMNLTDIAQHFPIIALSLIAVFGARSCNHLSSPWQLQLDLQEKKYPTLGSTSY